MNKVITGFGRSGTKFLTEIINACTDLVSFHEKTSKKISKTYSVANKTSYIEVNSYYRYCFPQDNAIFYLVLRRPSEICYSISKRYTNKNRLFNAFDDLVNWYYFLDDNIDEQSYIFFFDLFTQDEIYLKNMLKKIGSSQIDDQAIKDRIKIKINSSKTKVRDLSLLYNKKQINLIEKMDLKYEQYKSMYNR